MNSIDFLPERIRILRARHRQWRRMGYMLAVLIGGLGVLWYFGQTRVRSAEAEVRMLRGSSVSFLQQKAQRADLEQELQTLKAKQDIEQCIGSRLGVQVLLAELQATLPQSITLVRLELESKEQESRADTSRISARAAAASTTPNPKDSVKIRRVHMKLTGLAPTDMDVANMIGQLSASPLFEQVRMGFTRNVIIQGRQAREFEASCQIVR